MTPTPKEKAFDLVNLFISNAESRNKIGAFDEDLHQHNCKQCALILVDEILNVIDWHEFEIPNKELEYWEEVKQEIKNL
jgi:hypothetical protein